MSTYFLATLLGTDLHPSVTMAGEKANPSKVDSTHVDVKYDDITEESRKQFEAHIKKEQQEVTKRLLACYGKTRQGVIEKEKFIMPTFTPPPPNPSTTATATAPSASTTRDVSFSFESIKQFAEAFCSRFEQSQKLTQDLLIDLNLQLGGNKRKATHNYFSETPNANSSAAQTN